MPILALLKLVPLKVWLILIAAVLLLGWYWKTVSDAESRGAAATITKIDKANEKARDRADESERTVENCTGTWDRSRGVCVPGEGSARH